MKMLTLIESLEVGGLATSSPGVAVDALVNLVAEHEAGIWASTVPHLYRYFVTLELDFSEFVCNLNNLRLYLVSIFYAKRG